MTFFALLFFVPAFAVTPLAPELFTNVTFDPKPTNLLNIFIPFAVRLIFRPLPNAVN
jgi:hypothetical protein